MTRTRLYQIIEPAASRDTKSRIFDSFIFSLIIINIVAVILESFSELAIKYGTLFSVIEIFSITVFTMEYVLRLITASQKFPNSHPAIALLKFIKTPLSIIDLLAILPFYLPFIFPIDLRFVRILRLTRIARILKLNRYSKSLQLIGKIISKKKADLIITITVTVILIIFSASTIYYLETDEQPENFPNIITACWWAINTLTTVGYGDVIPRTVLGKILSGVVALLGVGLVALPTGIISSGFIEEITAKKKKKPVLQKSFKSRKYVLSRRKACKKNERHS